MDLRVCAVADLMGVKSCGSCLSSDCNIQKQVDELLDEIKDLKEEAADRDRELNDLEKQIEELNKE